MTDSDSMQISWSPKVHKLNFSWELKNTIPLVGERGVLMHKHSPRLPGGGGKPKISRLGPAYKKNGRAESTYLFGARGQGEGHSTYLVVWMGGPVDFPFGGG